MTFSELQEKIKKYRRKERSLECNLFWKKLAPGTLDYRNRKFGSYGSGLYVLEEDNVWKVYLCEYERGGSSLDYVFYSESDLYDFVFCYYKNSPESSYHAPEEEHEREQYDNIKMPKLLTPPSMFGVAGLIITLLGAIIWLAIQQNSIWIFFALGAPVMWILLSFFDSFSEVWSAYRLAKRNFEVYKAKKWVEICLCEISKNKIPETEYSFNGEGQGDHICIEIVKVRWQEFSRHHFPNEHTPSQETNAWKVSSFIDGEKIVHGIFSCSKMAYIFLFYQIAKRYADINIEKYRWGF